MRVGQRANEYGVDHAEDRGSRADSEGECEDDDDREARRLPHLA
jgi:hypothetical protein